MPADEVKEDDEVIASAEEIINRYI